MKTLKSNFNSPPWRGWGWVIFLIFFVCFNSIASEVNFEKGNELYSKGKFEEAIIEYQKILKTGLIAPDIYYNLGNCYFKTNDISNSILYYEKARKLNPSDEDVEHNLLLANSRTIDKIEPKPEMAISKFWNSVLQSKTTDGWASHFLIHLYLALAVFCLYLFANSIKLKKIAFFSGLALFIISIFTYALTVSADNNSKNASEAIIYSPTVNIFNEPSDASTKLFTLHEGTKVKIKKAEGDWIKIQLANGNIGWLKKETVAFI